jgi:hypothetical protein
MDWAPAFVVVAHERVAAGEVDVVFDEHEVARRGAELDAARCVGDEENAAAELPHDARREDDVVGAVALVGVDAAIHEEDGAAGKGTEQEAAAVAGDRAGGEVGDVAVGGLCGDVHTLGEGAESGAEDDADVGPSEAACAEVVGGLEAGVEGEEVMARVGLGHGTTRSFVEGWEIVAWRSVRVNQSAGGGRHGR